MKRVEGLATEGRTILFVSHNLDSIARFCNRTIWLDKGYIVKDGPTQDIIDSYVTQTFGIKSSKQWITEGQVQPEKTIENKTFRSGGNKHSGVNLNNIDKKSSEFDTGYSISLNQEAPGNEHVRLISMRSINKDRETIISINVDEPVGIEIIYNVLREEKLLLPSLRCYSATDVHLFTAVYTDKKFMKLIKPVGCYVSTVWIPENLLNTGLIYVSIAVTTPGPTLERHFVVERAISFNVLDVFDSEQTARSIYTREIHGALRPKLFWETRKN